MRQWRLKLDNPYPHPTVPRMYKRFDVRSLVSSAAVQLSPVPFSNLSNLRPGAVVISSLLRHFLSSCSPSPLSLSSPSGHSGSMFRPFPFPQTSQPPRHPSCTSPIAPPCTARDFRRHIPPVLITQRILLQGRVSPIKDRRDCCSRVSCRDRSPLYLTAI